MSVKTYPRIGFVNPRPNNTTAKCPCGQIAKFRVDVEWSHMRGDDEVEWRCHEHQKCTGVVEIHAHEYARSHP